MMIDNRYMHEGKRFAGGMAAVLICTDTILQRKVAIKIMPGSANKRRVVDELRALLKMRSKHVVQVYDVLILGKDDLAIVQEFIGGEDLFDESVAPNSEREFLKMIWQIASGISDIHALDVIHRDIKPNNMKLDSEGVIKIFDFGLARNEGVTAATVGFVGTPWFAAPELYQRNPTFTSAVDTYAFGITALFLANRDLPPELKRQPPEFCADYFGNTSFVLADEVIEILHSCLWSDPRKRPKMETVKNVLAKHLLHNSHRALVVHKTTSTSLDSNKRTVRLFEPDKGGIEISYDGFCFKVIQVNGDVFINNRRVTVGATLPGACVVALGAPEQKNSRLYITFDLSHPEIVL